MISYHVAEVALLLWCFVLLFALLLALFLCCVVYCFGGHGGVAQLGARLNGIQEVRGSTPLVSSVRNIPEPTPMVLCRGSVCGGVPVRTVWWFIVAKLFFCIEVVPCL